MVASKFIVDAAIQFKLGHQANDGPAPKFESDGRIQCKLGCNHPSQHCWKCYFCPEESFSSASS
ncbi:hypothetical protein PCANC_13600 [Puccinia coronata f. sp. avenae]|uniref:Uncharacterized protein n=1 Tax=Puccinia coronata f. sp. avenae TaxID=200324 RepID=A0A2N5T4Y5_9BASI|nr:hypothetical protein PCANC_13600 [Puccinia coronata f. sp. avenae]